MKYFKGVVVGIIAAIVASIAYMVAVIAIDIRRYPPPPGGEIGLDLRSFFSGPSILLVALIAFALGFWWVFRRAAR